MNQRVFHRRFNINRNESVPSRSTVLLWVRNFRETASAAKRKPPGREPSLRTRENIERVRQAFVRSPPLAGMCWQKGTPPHRHYIQEVNIVIKMFSDKDNFSNKFTLNDSIFSFYCNLKIIRFFCRTLYSLWITEWSLVYHHEAQNNLQPCWKC